MELGADAGYVCCGVADWEFAIPFGVAIEFEVGGSCFDVGGCRGLGCGIDDFVADEKADGVVVTGKGVHDSCEGVVLG